jgi:hypothetical protein
MEHNWSSKGRHCTGSAMMLTDSVLLISQTTVHVALRLQFVVVVLICAEDALH